MLRRVVRLLATLLVGFSAAASAAATTATNPTAYDYDAPVTARASARADGVIDHAASHLSGGAFAGSVGARDLSTTPLALSVATKTVDDFVDLASPARRTHILSGDATGGGHLWPGQPGKTPFPQSWSGDRIMHEISDIATDPAAWQSGVAQGSRSVLTGVRDGVEIRVIVNTGTGEIVAGYPINLPRNP